MNLPIIAIFLVDNDSIGIFVFGVVVKTIGQ